MSINITLKDIRAITDPAVASISKVDTKVEDVEDNKKLLATIVLSHIHYCLLEDKKQKTLKSHANDLESPFVIFIQDQSLDKNIFSGNYYNKLKKIGKDKTTLKQDQNGFFIEISDNVDKGVIIGHSKDFITKFVDDAKDKNLAQKLTGFAISNAILDCRDQQESAAGVFSDEKATVKYKIDDNGLGANGEEIKKQGSTQPSQTDHNPSYANIEAYVNKAKEYSDSKDEILKKVKSFTESFHDREGKLTAQGHAFNLIITLIAAKNEGLSSKSNELQKDIEELLKKKEVREALGVADANDKATIFALKEIACETSVRFKEIIERVKFINPPEGDYSKSADNPDRLCYNAELILKSQTEGIENIEFEKVSNFNKLLDFIKEEDSFQGFFKQDNSKGLKNQLESMIEQGKTREERVKEQSEITEKLKIDQSLLPDPKRRISREFGSPAPPPGDQSPTPPPGDQSPTPQRRTSAELNRSPIAGLQAEEILPGLLPSTSPRCADADPAAQEAGIPRGGIVAC